MRRRAAAPRPTAAALAVPPGEAARLFAFLAAGLLALLLVACGGDASSSERRDELREPRIAAELGRPGAPATEYPGGTPSAAEPGRGTTPPLPSAPPAATGSRPRVVFLGDSLTAGYGLAEAEAWPARVAAALAAEGLPIQAINAGVSGDTSAGGLSRVDWILRSEPDVVVVELGPNDGLRGLPLDATEENLREIVRRIEAAGAEVLLAGLQIPPNYGPDYAGRFRDLYPRLAAELGVPLVPFLLEGVGGEPGLNLPDGLHPNAAGHRRVADNVLPHLKPLVAAAEESG